jgi:hypothetical protein
MQQQIRWLRVSFWAGAIIDVLAAIQLLVPGLFAAFNQIPNFHPSLEYTFAAGTAASLMLGWTALLLWANNKPLERKGVLPITVVPVILGIVVTEVWAISSGFLAWSALVPTWILQVVLISLFTFSYFAAKAAERRQAPAGK